MYDCLVIGGGHAGSEAAAAAARMGVSVALVTYGDDNVGQMSCNPSIGGVGKGHLVRELDVFEGLMAPAADDAAIHYRMLNASKGPAVWGPRIQADRRRYSASVQDRLSSYPVARISAEVVALSIVSGRVVGVRCADGTEIPAKTVVVATGTFLGGRIFRGSERHDGGRYGERAASELGRQFVDLDLVQGRLKTGTPPRLDGRTIDWAKLEPQPSDRANWTMSIASDVTRRLPQLACAITRTNERTHKIIARNAEKSPLYAGDIGGRGPRYCPSIEDKVRRFADRDSHQLFLEPEGLDDHLVYPNGISTSLPTDVQLEMMQSIEGLEKVEIARPGYAVEYAFSDPRRLDRRLAHRDIDGLFLAGQINGTTGYEEAAAQGLVAGLNAAADVRGDEPFLFERHNSYIGVMVDDLVIHGVTEPYRMMTARAEFRLHLRADNAATRLGSMARRSGIGQKHLARLSHREKMRAQMFDLLAEKVSGSELGFDDTNSRPLSEWVSRPGGEQAVATRLGPGHAAREVLFDALYAPYLERQRREWTSLEAARQQVIPSAFAFDTVHGLSHEMVERLNAARPDTLDQASRVRGVTPAALTAIHLALARRHAA
ncbi:tRNA uridine-5-carboxymethylaminomethyl(34) synthesis enzyme MnmG [Sphingomicrobium nitratireducens]|uniref:tRNA uridine-5-carboxymethylaminomethyl(34) synthesis enzyme MnmG n=1 Tax=Sphingomicrobium nitratireducens TaxID=2964666 RepID=UPI00223FCDEB|nr:tRNA uridine-5-carboxymethylaminomethyl(34) synthesis enzyme MnmG [Sphingomicrobium nitratireducens]